MAKGKGARVQVTLEHRCELGTYRYTTVKNRRNTTERLELRKYSPVTKKHEIFRPLMISFCKASVQPFLWVISAIPTEIPMHDAASLHEPNGSHSAF